MEKRNFLDSSFKLQMSSRLKFLVLIVFLCLRCILLIRSSDSPALKNRLPDYRLSEDLRPIIYDVKLTLDSESDKIYGNVSFEKSKKGCFIDC